MEEFIESYVPEAMREYRVPGLSVAVLKESNVVYVEGFGTRDLERGLPATPDTLYGIGSCTKSFVGVAIMQLCECGVLRLDDPVSKYIPLKIEAKKAPITVHHLLTHSSGLPNLATSSVAINRGLGRDTGVPLGSVGDFYRYVNGAQEELASESGRRFFYNNACYRMLGHIIQSVSGVPFHRYIQENIVKPLGMERTTLVTSRLMADPDRLTPYRKTADGLEPAKFPYPDPEEVGEFSFISAAGGIASSVVELTRYLEMSMNGGSLEDVKILSPESVERMQEIHIERPKRYHGRFGYGYGWGVTENFMGHKMVSHGGSISVSTAYLAFIPDLKTGIAMASNSLGPPYQDIAEGIFSALMGKEPRKTVPGIVVRADMRALTGRYETYRGVQSLKVIESGGLLYLKSSVDQGENLTPLMPVGGVPRRFNIIINCVKEPVEFVENTKGEIDLYVERYRYHKKK
jgi:CubicO group peptidase (beta-lactamase class C family)